MAGCPHTRGSGMCNACFAKEIDRNARRRERDREGRAAARETEAMLDRARSETDRVRLETEQELAFYRYEERRRQREAASRPPLHSTKYQYTPPPAKRHLTGEEIANGRFLLIALGIVAALTAVSILPPVVLALVALGGVVWWRRRDILATLRRQR